MDQDPVDNMDMDDAQVVEVEQGVRDVDLEEYRRFFALNTAKHLRACLKRNQVEGLLFDTLSLIASEIEAMAGQPMKNHFAEFYQKHNLDLLNDDDDWDEWLKKGGKMDDDIDNIFDLTPENEKQEERKRYAAAAPKPPGKPGEIDSLRWIGYWLWTNRPVIKDVKLTEKEKEASKWTGVVNNDGVLAFSDDEEFIHKDYNACALVVATISAVIGKTTVELLRHHVLLGRYMKRIVDLNPKLTLSKIIHSLNQSIVAKDPKGKFQFLKERTCQRAIQLYNLVRPYPALLNVDTSVSFLLSIEKHLIAYFQVDPWYYNYWSHMPRFVVGKMSSDDIKLIHAENMNDDPIFKDHVADTQYEHGYILQ